MIGGLGYYNFHNSMDTIVKTTITSREQSASALVHHVSDAVHGGNYANLMLPSFKNQLKMHTDLRYFYVNGYSSVTNTPMSVTYNRNADEIWRTDYPPTFEQDLEQRIARLTSVKNAGSKSSIKVNYLLARLNDAQNQFHLSQELKKNYTLDLAPCRIVGESHLSFDKNILYITLPLTGNNQGNIELLYDIELVSDIRDAFLMDSIRELVLGMMISYPLLLLLSYHISSPIKNLSTFMRQNFEAISLLQVPNMKRKDEIGDLARAFSLLVDKVVRKNRELDEMVKHDPLTGLYNRRSLEASFRSLCYQANKTFIACFFIDIDHFKEFNDHRGHLEGDKALKRVADTLESFAAQSHGYALRLGGEEFVVLAPVHDAREAIAKGNQLRGRIKQLKIIHQDEPEPKYLTVSIGVSLSERTQADAINPNGLLDESDEALYAAKNLGRDQVALYSNENRDSA
ncbi:GGDEF domain-containing protein [Vibrio harveyi]|uniref:GGDEF domain-containing protein n=1 Tax=Vibrio harveyi TaxID=669 RepID=UPI00084E9E7F|nr:GGDEF domain-containing protein [Vibrio harveyi]